MRFKLLINPVLMLMVVSAVVTWRSSSRLSQAEERTVKVVVTQLPVQDNIVPVEIVRPVATSSASNVLDDVTYFLRNNSGKAISAVAVTKKILYREDGKIVGNTSCETIDFSFHPDFPSKPLAPAAEVPMEASGPTKLDNGIVIASVTLKIAYVQYVDGSAYGVGSEGERIVLSQREGAKKYKNLLRASYTKAGNSLVTIVPLLEQSTKLDQLNLTLSEKIGADRYRLHLLKTFQTKGATELEKYVKVKD